MITEKGKEYIARNFGVNNCYAMEEIVPCTVYSVGALSEQLLNTSDILFLIVSEAADWVRTAAGEFTSADMIAANDGNFISIMDSLEIEPYCISGAPPVTAPVTAPVTTPTGAKDYEILDPNVNCDSETCYARCKLKNNSSSASVYIRLEVDGAPRYKRHVYLLRGTEKPQVLSTSVSDLSPGYHNLTIAVGKVTDTDTYTHRFHVAAPGIEPPAGTKITKAEIISELGRRGAIDTSGISTTVGKNYWYIRHGEYGGTWLNYVTTNFEKTITLDIDVRNPPTQVADITLKSNQRSVSELDRNWVLARLGELPYKVAPTAPKPLTKAGFLSELKRCGEIDLSRVSTVPGDNKWFQLNGQVIYQLPGLKGALTIGRIPPTSTSHIQFLKDGKQVDIVEKGWALARLDELPYTGAPPAAAPVTPTEPPTAIKNWIVANYGDGTRVTTDGWRKLSDAEMAGALAPLPSGYTEADITGSVITWAIDNPNWETQTICGWISAIGLTNLTEDHGRYVYQLAKGRTVVADRIYNLLSPKPSKPPAAVVTEDNGRGVYQYAKGRKTTGNKITGCDF